MILAGFIILWVGCILLSITVIKQGKLIRKLYDEHEFLGGETTQNRLNIRLLDRNIRQLDSKLNRKTRK